jgi:hypothetical protein
MSDYELNDHSFIPSRHMALLSAKNSKDPTVMCSVATGIKRPEPGDVPCSYYLLTQRHLFVVNIASAALNFGKILL